MVAALFLYKMKEGERKNRLNHAGWLVFLVIGMLVALHWLPRFSFGGRLLRQVDILADMRPPKTSSIPADTFPILAEVLPLPVNTMTETAADTLPQLPRTPKPAFVDTCRTGLVCIEDYGDSTLRGMKPFYEALNRLREHPRPVRIAYFGDSFIEADILTADLRQMLQTEYGGHGVGYLPVSSSLTGYRTSVKQQASGWTAHTSTDNADFNKEWQDLSNRYFFARRGAYAEFEGVKRYARLDTCQQSSLFFLSKDTVTISASVNGTPASTRTWAPEHRLASMKVRGRIGTVRWEIERADSTLFYGVAQDDTVGIALDNHSLRGSSGLNLASVPMSMLRQFARLRPYDLIVLQYGVNVASQEQSDYSGYAQGMQRVVRHLKEAFPEAGILLVGVGDRDYVNDDGEVLTIPGIRNLVRYQQRVAANEGIAFWNMFEAMGGNESMKRLVEQTPSLAALDYTHLNFRGGKYLASLLFDAIQYGREQYDRRRAYEED